MYMTAMTNIKKKKSDEEVVKEIKKKSELVIFR